MYQEFVLCADIKTELNQMPGRPLREKVVISNTLCSDNLPTITTVPDVADHPLGNILLAIFKYGFSLFLNKRQFLSILILMSTKCASSIGELCVL